MLLASIIICLIEVLVIILLLGGILLALSLFDDALFDSRAGAKIKQWANNLIGN